MHLKKLYKSKITSTAQYLIIFKVKKKSHYRFLLLTHKQMVILENCTWLYQVVTHGDKAGFEVFRVHDSCSLLQDVSEGKTKPGGKETNREGGAGIAM